MPVPSLSVDWKRFRDESARLQGLSSSLVSLPPKHRKIMAEIILVRLFLLLENTIQSVGFKLISGAAYLDGTLPSKLVSARSRKNAYFLMSSYNRPRSINLSWTQSRDIRNNLINVLNQTDPFFVTVMNNGSFLSEIRYVRNHIVHSNHGTKVNFRKVVSKHYGGVRQGVSPGLLLLTRKLSGPPLMDVYFVTARVFIKDLVRA